MRLKAAELSFFNSRDTRDLRALLIGLVDRRPDQRCRKLFSCGNIIRATANLKVALLSAIHDTYMKMCVRNGLTGPHKAHNDAGNVGSDLL